MSFHPLWGKGGQDEPRSSSAKTALSPAWSSHRLYLPASLGLHCIWDQSYPSIYTPLLCASRAPALILYLMLARICTCSNNTWRFQNRSMMVDIYQTALRAYRWLDSVTYFDLEIKVILDKQALSDTFDKYPESFFGYSHCGCIPAILVHAFNVFTRENYMYFI